MALFPISLILDGRPCLVVGGGMVGEGKVRTLLESGARVRLVAPRATALLRQWAEATKIDWQKRRFRPSDCAGMFLAVVATSSPQVNGRIFREAQRRGVLCNVVDDPPHCDFYYPAVVRRGPLQIAISTGGRSPALAQRLRQEFEGMLAPDYGAWVEYVGRVRRRLLARHNGDTDRNKRVQHLKRLASAESYQWFRRVSNLTRQREVQDER